MMTCPTCATRVRDLRYDECDAQGRDILTAYCPECGRRVEPDRCDPVAGLVMAACLLAITGLAVYCLAASVINWIGG